MFECDICKSTFTRERDMRRHKKTIHEKSIGVCCNKCNKTFTRADNLKAHQKVCSKYFFFKYSLGQKFKTTFCNITHLNKKASHSRKTKYCCVRMHI